MLHGVTGCTHEEHLQNLTAVFESIRHHGLRIKLSKCKFFQESVEYLGNVVSKTGIHTSERKIKAITSVPSPTDVSKLRSFLGMVKICKEPDRLECSLKQVTQKR